MYLISKLYININNKYKIEIVCRNFFCCFETFPLKLFTIVIIYFTIFKAKISKGSQRKFCDFCCLSSLSFKTNYSSTKAIKKTFFFGFGTCGLT